ncbi:MAG: hypothetical protein WCE33_01905 [Nitrososphaeraceae archaeon]
MDELVTISKQMEGDIGPVIFINKFNVNPVDVDELHRGIAGSGTFINYAVWESTAHLKRAVNNVGVQARLSEYPASIVISPHIFKKVAVPGICVG